MRRMSVAAVLVCAGTAFGQAAVEISADGWAVAQVRASVMDERGVSRGGVPFGTTPDQVVLLRRQIGGLQIADMDNDGRNDLVAVCYFSSSFPAYTDWHDMIFFGQGSGIATTPGWISTEQTHTGDVQVGDLNGDGWMDIVAVHGGSVRRDSVRVYYGSGTGVQTTAGYASNTTGTAWGTAGVLADMDLDGDLDLVTTNQGLSPDPYRPVLMFRNDGGTLTTSSVWQSAEASIQNGVDAADLNGDGYPDLAVAKWVNFESGVYLNAGGVPQAAPAATVGATGTDKGAAIADVDGDGTPEIGFGGDPSVVYSFDGVLTPVYTADPPFSSPQDFRFFDVDGDGDQDLAEIEFSDGKAHIFLNRSGVLDSLPTWTYDAPEVGNAVAFGDLNGDGRADMALGYAGDTCIRVFFAEALPCAADLAEPFGVLDFFDVAAFLAAYNGQDAAADLAEPLGVWDFFDVAAFLAAYNDGCP